VRKRLPRKSHSDPKSRFAIDIHSRRCGWYSAVTRLSGLPVIQPQGPPKPLLEREGDFAATESM